MEAGILSQVILPFSIFIIMLGMGLVLKWEDFTRVLKEPKAFSIGIICQLFMLPLVGYLVVSLFSLTPELALGLMILTFCPGGVTSNMFSYLYRGDVALSVSMTVLTSCLTPFTIPVFTAIMMEVLLDESQQFSLPVIKTIIHLFVITVIPIMIGMILHKKFPSFSARMEKPLKIFSITFLFFIIAAIVLKNWVNMSGFFMQAGAATLTLNILTMITGYLVAKFAQLKKPQTISIAIEICIQNGTLALMVSGTLLGSTVMTIPVVTYCLLMFVTGGVFGWLVNLNQNDFNRKKNDLST